MRGIGLVFAVVPTLLGCLGGCGSDKAAPPSSVDDAGISDGAPVSGDGATNATDAATTSSADGGAIGGDRPVAVHVPPGYVAGKAAPLVILLHGYGASGSLQESYMGFLPQSDARGFLYAYPNGTLDTTGERFWNATDACCDLGHTMVDDSAYLSGLIKEIGQRYSVDAKRIFLIGHSNGAFMSYRMACDHPDQIAAIASLSGAMFSDVSKCATKTPVSIVEIHGTADATISYAGGMIQTVAYPGAVTTVSDWVTIDGCGTSPDTSAPAIDIDSTLPGNETTVSKYGTGCQPGGHAELWSVAGGGHIPSLSKTFAGAVIDYLYAHPRP